MKKRITMALSFVLLTLLSVHAQDQKVDNLCHTEQFSERIKVSPDVDLESLIITDKLKFKTKKYTKDIYEYLNDNDMPASDASIYDTENIFPKWYSYSTITRTDEQGIRSYYTNYSKYHKDGWVGSTVSESINGRYIEDPRTGERYLHNYHTERSKKAYYNWTERVTKYGYLYKYRFQYPTRKVLSSLTTKGFRLIESKNTITVSNDEYIFEWNNETKTYTKQIFEYGILVKTVKTSYAYHEKLAEHLISNVQTIKPGTFSNGDCYETISNINYNNYSIDCADTNLDARSAAPKQEALLALEIHPNPSHDYIKIQMPTADQAAKLQIYTMRGEILIEKKTTAGQKQTTINISQFPQGMYMLKVIQASKQYSSSFIKQ